MEPRGQPLSGRLVRSVPVVDHLREQVGSVTVQIDQHDLLGSLLAQSGAMVLAALLSGLLLRWLAQPLAQRINQPLDELSLAATAIAEGRIEQARLPEPGSDEIGPHRPASSSRCSTRSAAATAPSSRPWR